MERPDTPERPRTPITDMPGRKVAVPVWLLLVAGAALVLFSTAVGVTAGVLIGRATAEGGGAPASEVRTPATAR